MAEQYDYIVVGAGTAGCTIARRLAEDGRDRVLLVEAGGDDRHALLQMPAGLRSVFRPTNRFNWWYRTTPQTHLDGRRIAQPRGRVLGGSSSINGMTWLRGNPLDYERWVDDFGCRGWSFAECLPYFKRAERLEGGGDAYRGGSGAVGVRKQQRLSPLNAAFVEAARQAGLTYTADVNGYRQEGVGRFDMSVEGGVRSSAARAHLHLRQRALALEIRTRTRVERVLVDSKRATGVRLRRDDGTSADAWAGTEVILSAGAFATPQLLMLSGIGPPEHLRALGIKVLCPAPAVGANLHDHPEAHIQVRTSRDVSLNRELTPLRLLKAGIQWLLFRSGVAAANHGHVGAFVRSHDTVTHPDLQIHFFPVYFGADWVPDPGTHGYRLGVGPTRPTSRGSLRLDREDPEGMPLIDPRYLATAEDRATMRAGLRLGRAILGQEALQPYHDRETTPGPGIRSDRQLDAFIRANASSAYHPCGTCRMGGPDDAEAVVDSELRFRGLAGLRVVDASVIPRIPSANINATVFMIAERASDLVRGRSPLPAEPVDYHRADAARADGAGIAGQCPGASLAGPAKP